MGWVPSLTLRCSSFAHPAQRHHRDLAEFPLRCALELLLPLPAPAEPAAQVRRRSSLQRLPSPLAHLSVSPRKAMARDGAAVAALAATVDTITSPAEFALLSLNAAASALPNADVISITPSGHLRMAVGRDTFQRLGLPGKASAAVPGEQYLICVDLCAPSFKPGKKLHDKVLERVSELIPASLDYLCLFTRNGVPQPIDFPQPITARHVPFSAIHRALSPACLSNADKLFETATSASGLRGAANEGGEMETREGGGGGGEGEDMEWSGGETISPRHSDAKGAGVGEGKARAGGVDEGVGEGRAGSAGMGAAADMHEWIGAASCGMTRHMNECARRLNTTLDNMSSHATSATPPMTSAASPMTSAATGSVHSLRVCGPINSSQVLALIDAVRYPPSLYPLYLHLLSHLSSHCHSPSQPCCCLPSLSSTFFHSFAHCLPHYSCSSPPTTMPPHCQTHPLPYQTPANSHAASMQGHSEAPQRLLPQRAMGRRQLLELRLLSRTYVLPLPPLRIPPRSPPPLLVPSSPSANLLPALLSPYPSSPPSFSLSPPPISSLPPSPPCVQGEKRDARRRESCEAGETQAFVLLPGDRYLLFSCVHQGRGCMRVAWGCVETAWGHHGAAWGQHGGSMGAAWGRHGGSMGAAWGQNGGSMGAARGQHGGGTGAAWGPHGGRHGAGTGAARGRHGGGTGAARGQHGGSTGAARGQHGGSMGAARGQHGGSTMHW
ncbi:unnamed protein product [Closterium sp. Naga37s-1]|nr:unnamed protein product [Closterium sp. Naga37s-1]